MNLYQVKMKIEEQHNTMRVLDVLADTATEAISKAHETVKKREGEDRAEAYRVVALAEKAFEVVP